MSSAKDIPSESCVELYLQQELEILKEENHNLVTELENLKKKDVCCTLRKNENAVCSPMDQGAHWAFSFLIKFFFLVFSKFFFHSEVVHSLLTHICKICWWEHWLHGFGSKAYIFFTLIDLFDEKSCFVRGSTFTFTWDLPYNCLYFVTCVKFTRWYARSPWALTICTKISVENFRQMVLVCFWHRKQERDWVVPFTKYG